MLNADERDEDRDEDEEDADDSEKKDSVDEEEEDDAEKDEDEDSDDSDDDESDDEEDDKPVTRKELREFLRKNGNNRNANRRVHSKDRDKDRDRRHNSQSPKTEERLSSVEQSLKKTALLEAKRTFGYENSLSPAQVDVVFRMTKRPTKKFLETPYVKAALDTIAQQSNVRDNTPSGSGRTFKSQGGKSWDKMDANEKQQNFADRRRAILASKK